MELHGEEAKGLEGVDDALVGAVESLAFRKSVFQSRDGSEVESTA
jgi:hypothetical protein